MKTKAVVAQKIKYVVYCRKSTEEDNRQILSLDSQRKENLERAERLGLNVVDVLVESKSASVPGREKFNEMMGRIATGEVQGIICWALDRLSRNPMDGGLLQWLLQQGQLRHIVTSTGEHHSGDNAIVLGVLFGAPSQFVVDLKRGVRRGHEAKAQMGWPHGVAFTGFLNEKDGDRGAKKWRVDAERWPLVQQLFYRYLNGNISASQIAYFAREELKLTTPMRRRQGGKLIARSAIYNLLANPIYAGFFFLGGKRYELHPSMPRIITEEEHLKILRMMSGKNVPRSEHFTATYSGYMVSPYKEFIGQSLHFQLICECKQKFAYLNKDACPKCGKALGKIQNPKYLNYTYYYNIPRHKAKQRTRHIEEKRVDEFLATYIEKNLQLSPGLVEWSKKYLHELSDKELQQNLEAVRSQNMRKANLESKKKRYREMLAENLVTPDEYQKDVQEIEQELKSISQAPVAVDWLAQANDMADLTLAAAEVIRRGETKAKRAVLSRLQSNLIWDEEKLNVINAEPFQKLIDALAEAKATYPAFEPRYYEAEKDKTELFNSVCPTLCVGQDSNLRSP
ncbi:MAG: Recombinase [Parcubacteria group bacterium GW2011_GWA2_47_7]|nr:MAG: Recombinase [Parcubacteria group bacterium GW2011_GWA2_47_7]